MDEELTLHGLARREAERKLRTIPKELLESCWARDCQIEAVIDAVLAITYGSFPDGLAHARHVGEWSARIAALLPLGPDPSFARRVGVLCELEPEVLATIPELERFAESVREYQAMFFGELPEPTTVALIVSVADEFGLRVSIIADQGRCQSSALSSMLSSADNMSRPIVEALAVAMHHHAGPATTSHRS